MAIAWSLTSRRVGDAVVLSPGGELDLGTRPRLKEAVAAAVPPARRLVLDLAGLAFCDSTGIGGLMWARHHAAEYGGRLLVCAVQPPVARLLRVTGVDTVLTIFATVDDALAA